ncbi:MAG TPA: cbb3-type cytochrome c oxidase subunit I [Candidatus Acidoferrum sp.]|nr:cbb3-type cytochrome c oxidase subunit I [Candidatus Acidoferrum sp.]
MSEAQLSGPLPAEAAEADASSRPVLFLIFLGAACWAVLGSLFALVASIKFHAPSFLAAPAWLTYGRVEPAWRNCLLYGFCIQAGLGVALWLLARLGRTRVAMPGLVLIGTLLWNTGVIAGVGGVLWGDSTGFPSLEMPGYAAWLLMLGYLLIGLSGVLTFHARRERQLFVSQWFIFAALFWFPWIYATAELLLVTSPVRGAAQVAISAFYQASLGTVWLPLVGLAAAFYFIPKLAQRDLHSRYLALLVFWMVILVGGWTGIGNGAPLPAWMPAMSTVATMLLAVPLIAVALNVHRTLAGRWAGLKAEPALAFVFAGTLGLLLAWVLKMALAGADVRLPIHLTWLTPALEQLNTYGFFALVMFGAAYAVLPQVAQTEFPSRLLLWLHFWLAVSGVALMVVPLGAAGAVEAMRLQDPATPFMAVVKSSLPFLRASTTGDLLLLLAHCVFLLNVAGLAVRFYRPRAVSAYADATAELPLVEANP